MKHADTKLTTTPPAKCSRAILARLHECHKTATVSRSYAPIKEWPALASPEFSSTVQILCSNEERNVESKLFARAGRQIFVCSLFAITPLLPKRQPHPAPPSRHRSASCCHVSVEAVVAEDRRSNVLLTRLSTTAVREQGELCRRRCGS